MRIYLDTEKCIGCGSCEAICPDHFEMGNDSKAHLKGGNANAMKETKDVEENSCAQEGAEACPVKAVEVEK